MTRRNPIVVVVLSVLTCSIYAYYWLYVTTDELRRETGRSDLSPAIDLLLAIFTAGLWGMWATYRNARIVHEELRAAGVARDDKSLPIALFHAATFFTGGAWLVAVAILQDELNALHDEVARPLPPRGDVLATDAPMPVAY